MIAGVRLYECMEAVDYYTIDENGEGDECGNLVYTGDSHYLVEWYEGDTPTTQERQFPTLIDALAFYKEMKAKERE